MRSSGEVVDPRERARLLDQGLDRLTRYWSGQFEPAPVQAPRIPIWVAGRWPKRRPLERAARWDGFFPIELPGPDALGELTDEIRALRGEAGPFDIVVDVEPGAAIEPWEAAGATWVLTGFESSPRLTDVRAAIEAGPG